MRNSIPKLALLFFLCQQMAFSQQLVAWYKLDGNGNNSTSISGLNSTNSGSFNFDRCGVNNNALSMSPGGYLIINAVPNINLTSKLTISAWIRPTTISGEGYILSKSGGASLPGDGYSFGIKSGKLLTKIANGSEVVQFPNTTSGTIVQNQWQFVAMTFNVSTKRLIGYINGMEVMNTIAGVNFTVIGVTTDQMILGDASWIEQKPLLGSIDEVRIYNYDLSPSEILNLYQSTAVTSVTSPISTSTCEGGTQIFSVSTITGSVTGFNWRRNGSFLANSGIYSGTNTNQLTITGLPVSISGSSFSVSVTGACSNATTTGAILTVSGVTSAYLNPNDIIVCQGSNQNFPLLSVSGVNNIYQWLKDGLPIANGGGYSGTNSPTLNINFINTSLIGFYQSSISGLCGAFTTLGFNLTVNPATSIVGSLPANITSCSGTGVFSLSPISVSGTNLVYQWLKNGIQIDAFTDGGYFATSYNTSVLGFNGLTSNLSAGYSLSVAGDCFGDVSNPANLFIKPTTFASSLPGSSLVCSGLNNTISIPSVDGYNLSFKWYKDGSLINNSQSGLYAGFTTSGITINSIPSSFTGILFAEVSGDCNAPNPITTSGTNVLVNDITSILGLSNLDVETCAGVGSVYISPSTVLGYGLNYTWLKNGITPIDGTTDGGIYSFAGSTLAVNSFSGITATYILSATGYCGSSTALGLSLVTRPVTAIGNPVLSSANYCSGTNQSIFVNTVSGYGIGYYWAFGSSGSYEILQNTGSIPGFGGTLSTNTNSNLLSIFSMPIGLTTATGKVFVASVIGFCGMAVTTTTSFVQIPNVQLAMAAPLTVSGCNSNDVILNTSVVGAGVSIIWNYFNPTASKWTPAVESTKIINGGAKTYGVIGQTLTLSGVDGTKDIGYMFSMSVNGVCNSFFVTTPGLAGVSALNVQNGASPSATSNVSSCLGSNVQLSVAATGTNLRGYWWSGTNTLTGIKLTEVPPYSNVTFSGNAVNYLNISTITSALNQQSYFVVFDTDCGSSILPTPITLSVNTVPSIINDPTTAFSTCPGYDVAVSSTVTGYPYPSLIWQSYNAGAWNNLSDGANYQNTATPTLTLVTPQATVSGMQFRLVASNYCGVATTTGKTFNAFPTPIADYFTLKNRYCNNQSNDLLISATNLPTIGGSFYSTPIIPGLINSTLAGQILFNPTVVTSPTSIALSYNSLANVNGCVTTVTYSTFVNTVDAVDFYSPSITQYIYKSGAIADLAASPTTSGVGAFSGAGVIGSKFYVDLVDYPSTVNANFTVNINFTYTNTLTGCTNQEDKTIAIVNTTDKFKYYPASGYSDLRPVLTVNNNFCISDNSIYSLSFTGSLPPQGTRCVLGLSINVVGKPSVLTTTSAISPILFSNYSTFSGCVFSYPSRNKMDGYMLKPSNFNNEGIYVIRNQFDVNDPSAINCGGCLLSRVNSGIVDPQFSENITITGLSAVPAFNNFSSLTFCGVDGKLGSLDLTKVIDANGTNLQWYISTSGMNVSIPGALANSRTLAEVNNVISLTESDIPYQIRVSQNANGCRSSFSDFYILVRPKPSVPTLSGLNVNRVYCQNEASFNANLVVISVPGFIYNWYGGKATDQNIIERKRSGNENAYIPDVPTFIDVNQYKYFVKQSRNGCESDSLAFVVTISGVPEDIPTVIAPFSYCVSTAGFISPFTIAGISTVSGLTTSAVVNWYDSKDLSSPVATTGLQVGSVSGASTYYFSQFNTGISILSATSVNLATKLVYTISGCSGSYSSSASTNIYNIPTAPTLKADDFWNSTENKLGDLCNNQSVPGINASGATNAIFTWYYNSSLTGKSVTGVSFIPDTSSSNLIDIHYYATQKLDGCESPAADARVVIKAALTVPGIINTLPVFYCTGADPSTIARLTATGINTSVGFNWYRGVGGAIPANRQPSLNGSSEYDPGILTIAGFDTVLLTQTSGSCESNPLSISIEYRKTPFTPLAGDTAVCLGAAQWPTVTVKGDSATKNPGFKWYADATLSTYINSGNTLLGLGGKIFNNSNLSVLGNIPSTLSGENSRTDYYVTQTIRACESPAAVVGHYLVQVPTPPSISTSKSLYCSGETLRNLNAINLPNASLKWYLGNNSLVGSNASLPLTVNNNIGWNTVQQDSLKYVYSLSQTAFGVTTPGLNFKGCESPQAVQNIVVYPYPPAPMVTNPPVYCGNSALSIAAITASGIAFNAPIFEWYKDIGGVRLKGGVVADGGNIFNPSNQITNKSPADTISYKYFVSQTAKNCRSNYAIGTVKINPTPVVNFLGLNANFCDYENPVTLTGSPLASINENGSFYSINTTVSSGITTLPGGYAIFNPSVVGYSPLNLSLAYRYTNQYGCSDSITKAFKINKVAKASLTNISPILCVNGSSFDLNGSPIGGIYFINTNKTITGAANFNPREYLGTNTIRYEYKDAVSQCKSDTTVFTEVKPKPVTDFALSTFCTTDNISFINLSSISGGGNLSYNWLFVEDGSVYTVTSPIKVFSKFGDYNARLTAVSEFGCTSDELPKPFNIGKRAAISLGYKYTCDGQLTEFTNNSSLTPVTAGVITKYEWDFDGSGLKTFTGALIKKQMSSLGNNLIKFRVTTNKNCAKDTSFSINILPVVNATDYPKSYDFNTNDSSYWYSAGVNKSWQLGSYTDNVFAKGASDKFWVTGGDSIYNSAEKSYIYSPCFDFTQLSKPMVSFNYASQNTNGGDGAVLQYSIDEGVSWAVLGELNSGINWYNQKDITSNPGDQLNFNLGWSGTSYSNGTSWVNARHTLDTLSGKKNVRFRLGFSALDQEQTLKGFAFDDFIVGSRSQGVLLENFVNANNLNSNELTTASTDVLLNQYFKDAMAIEYHTSFPAANPFNTANPADASARVLYYGVENVPRTFLNGNRNIGVSSLLTDLDIVKKSLESPLFDIKQTIANDGSKISADIEFTSIKDYGDETTQLVGFAAVVERNVTNVTGSGGKNNFDWVNRKMLPDAAGELFVGKAIAGTAKQLTQTWTIDNNVANKNNLGVVAFIQNNTTKEVLQSAYFGPKMYVGSFTGAVTALQEKLSDADISVYPNPTTGEINIVFSKESSKDLNYILYDFLGNTLTSGTIPKETVLKKLVLNEYSSGLYFLKIDSLIKKVTLLR